MTVDVGNLNCTSSESPNKSSGDIGERTWSPEQFWEFTEGRDGEFSAQQLRDVMEDVGLVIVPAAEIERLRRELGDWKQAASVEAGLRREFLKRAETAESAVADAMEALKPFEEAYEAVCYDDGVPDDFNIWESPAAMSITVGDLRRASAIRAACQRLEPTTR